LNDIYLPIIPQTKKPNQLKCQVLSGREEIRSSNFFKGGD